MAVIALIGAASLWQTDWQPAVSKPFEDGVTQPALEDAFDKGLIPRKTSIHLWNAFRYAVFSETLPGAVPGKDGWLFTDEEFETGHDYADKTQAQLMRIVEATRQLEGAGATVIIALLPDKARVMSEKLSKHRSPQVEARYDMALDYLTEKGIAVDDLRDALQLAKSGGDVFMRTDTHWSPHGAKQVANTIAHRIQTATTERTEFITEMTGVERNEGDLVTFVDSGQLSMALGLSPEPYETFVTTQTASVDAGLSLFDDTVVPATLIGTSYSAIQNWNFEGFLKEASQTDILNRAEEGRGPFAPMDDYLKQITSGEPVPQIVVWEIPERYLTVEASQ
ncbi:alginate O-acetyltransferase complex protein AlgJ [Pacificibacter maritimus]|uniref:Alginate O-acetyltransferase complex protein AlgJ n=1 Tax=Pacificibacter maritimus TaxID=762213 RepID=A0A3N4UWF7_9RHOB|nr:hypothetical protein [Pacificibacter maritimus]RPE71859.1 alginate O-acetyltransferase complex protein AlgJ [Pacificibacter maritimus]